MEIDDIDFFQIRLYDDYFCLDNEFKLLPCVNDKEIEKIETFPKLIFHDYNNDIMKHFINTKIMEEIIEIKYSNYWDWNQYEH